VLYDHPCPGAGHRDAARWPGVVRQDVNRRFVRQFPNSARRRGCVSRSTTLARNAGVSGKAPFTNEPVADSMFSHLVAFSETPANSAASNPITNLRRGQPDPLH